MFTLKDYKKLGYPIRSIAAQHLVAYLLDLSGLEKPNELHNYFDWLRSKNGALPPMPSESGHFWIDKTNGVPIKRGYLIKHLELYISNITYTTIGHPLWQAIDYDGKNKALAYKILKLIEPELSTLLFKKNPVTGTLDRKPVTQQLIISTAKFNSMGALTVLLVFFKEVDPYQYDIDSVTIFKSTIKQIRNLIYRLSLFDPFSKIAFNLYKYIHPKIFLRERYFLRHGQKPTEMSKLIIKCKLSRLKLYQPTLFFPSTDERIYNKFINMISNFIKLERCAGKVSSNSKDILEYLIKIPLYQTFIGEPEELNIKKLLCDFYYPVKRKYQPIRDW